MLAGVALCIHSHRALAQEVLYATSFEDVSAGPIESLSIDGVDVVSTGECNNINQQFAKSGSQCLQVTGDAEHPVNLVLPEALKSVRGLSFYAGRYTSRRPFEFSVQVQQNDVWWEVASLDFVVKVRKKGNQLRTPVILALPEGSTTAIRFVVRAPEDSGVLIDDIKLYSDLPEELTDVPRFDPFQHLPEHFDLPAPDETEPVKIADVANSKGYLTALFLLTNKDTARGTIRFSLIRDENDNQRWTITKQNRGDEAPVEVAVLWKDDFTLNFQWREDAAADQDVNYLRNAVIKLETFREVYVNLRAPVVVEGFKLESDLPDVRARVEASWLPRSGAIVVELKDFPDRSIPSVCSPELVTRKPARMYFTGDAARAFVWLEVDANTRTLGSINAGLKVLLEGELMDLRPDEIPEYRERYRQIEAALRVQLAEMSTEEQREQLRPPTRAARITKEAFDEYASVMSDVVGQDIPVAAYYVVEGRRVLIARTPGVPLFDGQVDNFGG